MKNARLGMVRVGGVDMYWFDFLTVDGQESLAQLPENERLQSKDGIAHDGQYTVNEALFEKKLDELRKAHVITSGVSLRLFDGDGIEREIRAFFHYARPYARFYAMKRLSRRCRQSNPASVSGSTPKPGSPGVCQDLNRAAANPYCSRPNAGPGRSGRRRGTWRSSYR